MEKEIVVEPPLYFAESHIFDLNFHPNKNALSCCLINGIVKV